MSTLDRSSWPVLACALCLASAAVCHAQVASDKATAGDTATPAAAYAWQVGDIYEIRAERRGIGERMRGSLVKVTPRWIVLHVVSTQKQTEAPSGWADAPLIGPLFRKTRMEKAEQFVWVPRDAALIEKHQPLPEPDTIAPPPGDDPPRNTGCTVQLAGHNAVARRDGGLEAVTAKKLTLSVPKVVAVEAPSNGLDYLKFKALGRGQESRTEVSRQELSVGDVLCVRVANFEAAARRAVAR